MEFLTVSVHGEKRVHTGLRNLTSVFGDMTPIMDAVGFEQREDTLLRLHDQEDIDGMPFKPSYRAQAQGGQTLLDKGMLRNSIAYFATKTGVEWGSAKGFGADKYARIHNEGGMIEAKKKRFLRFRVGNRWVMKRSVLIPKRQYLGFTPSIIEDIRKTFIATLEERTDA